jgi:GT2 family glycosyltransferase
VRETTQPDAGLEANRSLALAFATIERPQATQRLIVSARARFPQLPIYVADQSRDVAAMTAFYAHMDVNLVRLPYDAGVCAARNRLVEAIAEDHFVLCDDDFVFGERTDFAGALRILKHDDAIGIVGGKLYDFDGNAEAVRHWELYLHLDTANRTLTSMPIYELAPRVRQIGSIRYYLCDAVMNFAVFRRNIFTRPTVRWDERFKSNGEHEDFYLNLKLNSSVKVAYLPTMVAYHHHPEEFERYRLRLRERLEGWKQFFLKWDLEQHLELGLGVRSVDDYASAVPADQAWERFFLNADLSLRRERESPALLIGEGSPLHFVGGLDGDGEPTDDGAPTARLLLHTEDAQLVAGPVMPPVGSQLRGPVAHGSVAHDPSGVEAALQRRYQFLPAGPLLDPERCPLDILFRYDPVERAQADFVLWYRVAGRSVEGVLAAHLRWYADDGGVLMWESDAVLLDLSRSEYWTPLLVPVPVRPRASSYMRFDVTVGDSARRQLLASGFVFAVNSTVPGDVEAQSTVADVAALRPANLVELDDSTPPCLLDRVDAVADGGATAPYRSATTPGALLIPLDELAHWDRVLLFGSPGLGPPVAVIIARREPASAIAEHAPAWLALPVKEAAALRLVGFSRTQGYRRIPLELDAPRADPHTETADAPAAPCAASTV